jgi:hypothetical protein
MKSGADFGTAPSGGPRRDNAMANRSVGVCAAREWLLITEKLLRMALRATGCSHQNPFQQLQSSITFHFLEQP